MINGAHTVIFSQDAEADRAFFRDVLGFPAVDGGGGWLIFALPPAEAAFHPADAAGHELYLLCDDLAATMAELADRGVTFVGEVEEARWGSITQIPLPSGAQVKLYEPHHPRAHD